MAQGALYWIDPYGKILKQHNTTHIQEIVSNPKVFGVTRPWIEKIYEKHDEPVGTEGNAREEIIQHVLKKGFIRVRLYINKFWSITLTNFKNRRTKKSLAKWAEDAKDDKMSGKYMPVKILDTKSNKSYNDWTVQDIYFDKHLNESDIPDRIDLFKPEIVHSITELTCCAELRSFEKWLKEKEL